MGWKVYVPDNQLEHEFHQISEFSRGVFFRFDREKEMTEKET